MTYVTFLFLLWFAHCLADYPLQGDFLANAKNRNTELGKVYWPHALLAHSTIHGGFVMLITGSVWLGLLELVIHGITDFLKCEGKIDLDVDQMIHYLCKCIWAGVAAYFL